MATAVRITHTQKLWICQFCYFYFILHLEMAYSQWSGFLSGIYEFHLLNILWMMMMTTWNWNYEVLTSMFKWKRYVHFHIKQSKKDLTLPKSENEGIIIHRNVGNSRIFESSKYRGWCKKMKGDLKNERVFIKIKVIERKLYVSSMKSLY
jgi:hypothetical protein